MTNPLTPFESIQFIDQLKEMINTNDYDFCFLESQIHFKELELEKYISKYNQSSLKNAVLEALNRLSENAENITNEDDEHIKNELLHQYRNLLIDTLIETIKGEKK